MSRGMSYTYFIRTYFVENQKGAKKLTYIQRRRGSSCNVVTCNATEISNQISMCKLCDENEQDQLVERTTLITLHCNKLHV